MPTREHELELQRKLLELEGEGWKVISIRNHPDAIVTKDGKVAAVEVLTYHRKRDGNKQYGSHTSPSQKLRDYKDFDRVIFSFVQVQRGDRATAARKWRDLLGE